MNQALRQLLAPSGVWPAATLLALGVIAVAAVVTPAAEPERLVDTPLVYTDGEAVPGGHWSVLCIDGVAYLEIDSPRGYAVVPKLRENGLVARCTVPAGV
jgi:hypothetical protein